MEDLRQKERIENFMKLSQEEPNKKREQYMVSLRKKKKSNMFQSKRKILWSEYIKGEKKHFYDIIPDFFILHTAERVGVCVEKFIKASKASKDNELHQLLGIMANIVDEHWLEIYSAEFLNKEMIEQFSKTIKIPKLQLLTIEVFNNIMFNIESINTGVASCIFTSGLLDSIMDNIYPKEQPTDKDLETCEKCYTLISNLIQVHDDLSSR
jgi:hypothetical protein